MVIRLDENYNAMTSTALLGYVGETNARPVSVEGLTVDGADRYVLTIDYGDGVTYEVDITGGQWTPTADILRSAQTVSCQICAKKLSGDEYILVKKTRIFRLRIGAAIGDNAVPSPDVAMDALDRIDAIGRQTHADMQTAVTAAETATTAAENAKKSATNAEKSADTATQAASRAETAQASAETSATQADTARQGAETARTETVTAQNAAKISAAQASVSAQQTTADKTITAGYAKTAKTNADSTAADRQAVADMAEQVEADKTTVADNATKVAEDRTAAETAAQTAQAVADSLPDDYVTAVGKIAENTAEIGRVKLTDKELTRRVNALYSIGNGITHQFETDSETAYVKTIPTGAKLMSVKSVGGRSIVFNQLIPDSIIHVTVTIDEDVTEDKWISRIEADTSNIISAHGHKVLGKCVKDASNPTANVVVRFGDNNANISNGYESEHSTEKGIYSLQPSVKNGALYYRAFAGATAGTYGFTLQLFDLTAMFGSGNEPASVEEFEKMFPADYYPYNAGEIISADTESIIEQGANLYYGTDMLKCGSDDYEYIANSYRCKAIKLKPNTTYTLSFTSDKTSEIILLMNVNTVVNSQPYLDFRKTSDNRSYRTGDNGCLYVGVYAGNGNVASADVVKRLSECKIMISEGDTPTAYAPFHRNEYPIPDAIKALPGYGWLAGTARNYIDYENKRYVQCVSSVDLGTLKWMKTSSQSVGDYFYAPASTIGFKRLGAFGTTVHNILCSKYITVARNSSVFVDKTITLDGDSTAVSQIQVKDTAYTDATAFKQAMQGVILYYELETPIVTDISSLIPDDFLRNLTVEAGGSVTFKGGNDDYRIPVPSEEEYIVRLSEVGGTT
ncbi:hypothetical protein LKD24_09190 [Oscillospiraceae bacterium CLA-AA-H220]|nr:hypothetical protein [Hominimerdicola aceti]